MDGRKSEHNRYHLVQTIRKFYTKVDLMSSEDSFTSLSTA
jgi:hypothetical protein